MKEAVNIAVCIPSTGQRYSAMATCVEGMLAFIAANPFPGYAPGCNIERISLKGSLMPKLREDFFKKARKAGCTHALCLDADQTFPRDVLHRLLMAEKPIVACNIATKELPSRPTARSFDGTKVGRLVRFKTGLEQIWRVGLAVALVDLKAIEPLGKGIFEVTYDHDLDDYIGEDWTFCGHAEKHGIGVWIDHDLSKQVAHIGDYAFTYRDIPQFVEAQLKAA